MHGQLCFPRAFTEPEMDALFQLMSSRFVFCSEEWQPLLLNGVALGFTDGRWRSLLERDWSGGSEVIGGALNLTSQDWLSMGDALQSVAQGWHDQGEFYGWRNERFDVLGPAGEVLFALERSAFRPLGLLSRAVHINGLAERDGKMAFWIGRRSPLKAVDPDMFDNMVGGGIACGESVEEAMAREAWEEAGLTCLDGLELCGRLLSMRRIPRGLHREWLYIFDVLLPRDVRPENQDGEVAEFRLMDMDELAEAMIAGLFMNDAMLATLDCCRRHGLVDQRYSLGRMLQEITGN